MPRTVFIATAFCLAAPIVCGGCLGAFAANQGRRQAARSADHYVRKYVEPELGESFAGDPGRREEYRRARNELSDTIVRTGNPRQRGRVGVDDRGWLTKEGR